ncbi:hypothetical protein EL17_12430 [Anditalea andensis]|uniref:Uncharacterized protein n=2 Tax=Anditalea andensis TaxID=1048983 RepID=A0A074KW71_9BACT|nr:hypothetical protein EL17_12430 [Anditalea andensis]
MLFIATAVLVSCESGEDELLKNPVQIDNYFPLSQFIDRQIGLLDGRKIGKEININGEKQHLEQVLNVQDWREEFDWLIQSDINKASLAQSYHTEEQGNRIAHTLKSGEQGTLQQMEILYEGDQVKEINIISSRKNTFYQSKAIGRLTVSGDGLIDFYSLESIQKVWFLEPNNLIVNSRVHD